MWPTRQARQGARHNDTCTMAFGRPSKATTCPRCEELKSGAQPVKGWGTAKREADQRLSEAIRNHNCKASGCGPVCTANEW